MRIRTPLCPDPSHHALCSIRTNSQSDSQMIATYQRCVMCVRMFVKRTNVFHCTVFLCSSYLFPQACLLSTTTEMAGFEPAQASLTVRCTTFMLHFKNGLTSRKSQPKKKGGVAVKQNQLFCRIRRIESKVSSFLVPIRL